jgi:hypothetical protein
MAKSYIGCRERRQDGADIYWLAGWAELSAGEST